MTPTAAPATADPTAAAPSDAALAWSKKLVSFDTTSRNSNLALIHSMADELTAHGITPLIVPSPDGRKANLFATIPARDGALTGGIMLAGHTDVVPVDGQAWESHPFTAEVREGRLYGRGTTDMKAFSAAILGFLPEFLSRPLAEPLHFAWTYDEEVGCHGAVILLAELKARGIHPRIGFVGEPTSMRPVSAHKSSQLYRVTVNGIARPLLDDLHRRQRDRVRGQVHRLHPLRGRRAPTVRSVRRDLCGSLHHRQCRRGQRRRSSQHRCRTVRLRV